VANIIFKVYHIVFDATLLCLYCTCVSTKFESNVNIECVLLHCGYKFMTSIFLFKIPVSFLPFDMWFVEVLEQFPHGPAVLRTSLLRQSVLKDGRRLFLPVGTI